MQKVKENDVVKYMSEELNMGLKKNTVSLSYNLERITRGNAIMDINSFFNYILQNCEAQIMQLPSHLLDLTFAVAAKTDKLEEMIDYYIKNRKYTPPSKDYKYYHARIE